MATLYEQIGGRPALDRVHKVFYDKVYAHPWLRLYFEDQPQEHLEQQQSDFMSVTLGGPDHYAGMLPRHAHRHMNISRELFDLRHELLRQAIVECHIPAEGALGWLRIDKAFAAAIVKKSPDDCVQRYSDEPVLDFPNPDDAPY